MEISNYQITMRGQHRQRNIFVMEDVSFTAVSEAWERRLRGTLRCNEGYDILENWGALRNVIDIPVCNRKR